MPFPLGRCAGHEGPGEPSWGRLIAPCSGCICHSTSALRGAYHAAARRLQAAAEAGMCLAATDPERGPQRVTVGGHRAW